MNVVNQPASSHSPKPSYSNEDYTKSSYKSLDVWLMVCVLPQDREGQRGGGEVEEHDGGGEEGAAETQPSRCHQQGREGEVQVPTEVLPQRSLLSGESFPSSYAAL